MTEAITYGMAKPGIHIKRANVGSVEAHNLRTEQYLAGLKKAGVNIYFFQELSHNNRSWVNPRYKGKTCEQLKVVSSLRFNLQQLNNYFHGHEWLRVKQENERIIMLLKNLLKI